MSIDQASSPASCKRNSPRSCGPTPSPLSTSKGNATPPPNESAESAQTTGPHSSKRLQVVANEEAKAKIIQYIDSHFANKQQRFTLDQVAGDIMRDLPLLRLDKKTQKKIPCELPDIREHLHRIKSRDSEAREWHSLFSLGVKLIKPNRLRLYSLYVPALAPGDISTEQLAAAPQQEYRNPLATSADINEKNILPQRQGPRLGSRFPLPGQSPTRATAPAKKRKRKHSDGDGISMFPAAATECPRSTSGLDSFSTAASTTFLVSPAALALDMQHLFDLLESRIHQEVEQRNEYSQPAEFVDSPSRALRRLYHTIVGDSHAHDQRAAITSHLSTAELALAMVSAFLHDEILDRDVCCFEDYASFFDKILDATTAHGMEELQKALQRSGTSADTIYGKVYHERCESREWTDRELRPSAKQLARFLAGTLHEQLRQGTDRRAIATYSSSLQLADSLVSIILKTLLLKCKMSISRDKLETLWYTAGEHFQRTFMEAPHEQEGVVMLTKFPGLAFVEGDDWQVIIKAQVEVLPNV